MSLRALAFGPLPKSQVKASQRIGQSTPSSGPSLSALGSGVGDTGQGFDAALTVGGPQREAEGFSPVFPDLFGSEDTAAAEEPDFNSETAQTLANPPSGTGVVRQPGELPDTWRVDLDSAFKALKGLSSGVKAIEGSKGAGSGGSAPMVDTSSLSGLSGEISQGLAPPSDIFDPGAMGWGLPSGGGGGDFSVGGGLAGAGSLYNLANAAEAGNPAGIASGAIGAYGGITGAAGVSPISSSILSASPEIASAVVNALTGAATTAQTVTTQALTAALGSTAAAAAPIIQGIVQYLQNAEEMRARDSGWWNNPIKGALYSNSTAGVGQANKLVGSLGDLTGASSQDLLAALTGGSNSLLPYYSTAQGGRGPIRASDTVTGRKQGPTSSGDAFTGNGGPEAYTQNFTQAKGGIEGIVQELLRRGATYEELGQLPVSGNWAQESLDAGGRPSDFYAKGGGKYDTEGQGLLSEASNAAGWNDRGLTLDDLLQAAQGGGASSSAANSKASNLVTDMYGGPLWASLARMGTGGSLGDLIQQNFDPWKHLRAMTPAQRQTALSGRAGQRGAEQSARQQDFTSGGM